MALILKMISLLLSAIRITQKMWTNLKANFTRHEAWSNLEVINYIL